MALMSKQKIPMSSATNPNAANYKPKNFVSLNPNQNPYAQKAVGFNQSPYAPQQGVLGASTGGGSQIQQPQQPQQNNNVNFQQAFNAGQPEQPSIDYDALIRPALDALESSIAPLQQGFSDYQGQQQGVKGTQLAQNQQNVSEQSGMLESSRTKQNQAGESAIDEARRGYSEIQQGISNRYGGRSGLAGFATGYQADQTLRNIADIRTGLAQSMQEIDDKLVQVKSIGDISRRDIEDKVQERILQAKSNLDNQISDIRRQQGVLQSEKAKMAAGAIQEYQNSVNQYKQQQQSFLQTLYTQQVTAEQELTAAKQKGQSVAESYKLYNLNIGGQNTPIRIGNKGTVQGIGGQSAPQVGPGSTLFDIGTQQKEKEEDDLSIPNF